MKLLTDWGFSWKGWRTGHRGEYLVLLQGALMAGFLVLPVYPLPHFFQEVPAFLNLRWSVAGVCGLIGVIFCGKGLLDLGKNLTPLPYPKTEGELVTTGIYQWVRHPLYSGLIFAAFGWTIFQGSLSHLILTLIWLVFFDIKARREEAWLTEKYPQYADYQKQVKKLIPGVY